MTSLTSQDYQDAAPQGNLPPQPQLGIAKLKNSCDACTAAKVGCTKEKPSCARCVKRRCSCVYSSTKRIRRVPPPKGSPSRPSGSGERPHDGSNATTCQTPEDITVAAPQQHPGNESIFFPISTSDAQASNWMLSTTTTSDAFTNLLSPGDSSTFTFPSCAPTDWDQEFECLGSLAAQDADQVPGQSDPSIFDIGDSILGGYLSTETDAGISGPESSTDLSHASSKTSIFGDTHMGQGEAGMDMFAPSRGGTSSDIRSDISHIVAQTVGSDSSCACLVRIMALLARLSRSLSESDVGINTKRMSQQLGLDSAMEQNTKAVQLIKECLCCSCATDGYTLVLLLLVVLAVLNRYTTAAADIMGGAIDSDTSRRRQHHHSDPQSTATEEQRHRDNRRILSQLTAVQSLIKDLGERVMSANDDEPGPKHPKHAFKIRPQQKVPGLLSLPALSIPIPPTIMQQLHAVIRSRLHDLSRAIIQSIRGR
ncbi:hypothetical protein CERZMDRAFT_100657 [Cercospora zeae-maydis SCOH1-5]|uniref:Zn(2)-C6 fungal-type domain-containing protein n=1 Tax=Cercospora zeae-maydis SCOH1-5 TaxID=717836 RepID=A0A6A6F764_9PEZI|nr:hypothetical protein CERZMDRAFT_100657 [Cercospora zeae-maydis SCOH1-5]